MKRRLTMYAVFLRLGAIVNVAVAWASGSNIRPTPRRGVCQQVGLATSGLAVVGGPRSSVPRYVRLWFQISADIQVDVKSGDASTVDGLIWGDEPPNGTLDWRGMLTTPVKLLLLAIAG